MDLSKMIADEMEKALSADAIRAEVRKNLERLCEAAVKEAFAGWGGPDKPGRILTGKIEAALAVRVSEVDLSAATLGLVSQVEQEVAAHLRAQVDPIVKERIAALLKPAPAVLSLADIVREYRDAHDDDLGLDGAERMGLVIECKDAGWMDVGLHPKPTHDKFGGSYDYHGKREQEPIPYYCCDVGLRLKKDADGPWRIWLLNCRGAKTSESIPAPALTLTAFERGLYQAFVAGSTVEVESLDPNDYDVRYPDRCEC